MDNPEFTEAIWHSDLAFVRRYLQERRQKQQALADGATAELGRTSDGNSPLHLCVRGNAQPELFGLLLRAGGCCPADRNQEGQLAEDLFQQSKFGPLYREELDCLAAEAIRCGHLDRLESWLLQGWAVPDRREEAFRALVADGALTEDQLEAAFDGLARLQHSIERLHESPLTLPQLPRLLESLDQCGLTLLHKAVLAGDTGTARRLLEVRPDLADWPDFLGRPPIFYCSEEAAAAEGVEGGAAELRRTLLAGGSRPPESWNPLGCAGATANQLRARLAAGCARRQRRLPSLTSGANESM